MQPGLGADAALSLQALLESNLPLSDEAVREATRLIACCSEAELCALGLGPPPRPVVPRGTLPHPGPGPVSGQQGGVTAAAGHGHDKGGGAGGDKGGSPQQRLRAVQGVISSLQYNHSPGYHHNVAKGRPFSRIMDTARDALRAALPIKCLEAVFLGALLTAGWADLDRLPLAFKSCVQGQVYRHIVLAVFHGPSRRWGALGLSRRPELMDKDLAFDSLADLVADYRAAYGRWWHTLQKVYVGLPLEHDSFYPGPVCWRYLTLNLQRKSWAVHRAALDKFAGQARRLQAKFRALGAKPAAEASLTGAGPGLGASGAAAGVVADEQQAVGGGGGGGLGGKSASRRHAQSVSPGRRRNPPHRDSEAPASPARQSQTAHRPPSMPASQAPGAPESESQVGVQQPQPQERPRLHPNPTPPRRRGGGGGGGGSRARRSSDPGGGGGGGAAAGEHSGPGAAQPGRAAGASGRTSARAQARMLRQQERVEEEKAKGAGEAGTGDTGEAAAGGDADGAGTALGGCPQSTEYDIAEWEGTPDNAGAGGAESVQRESAAEHGCQGTGAVGRSSRAECLAYGAERGGLGGEQAAHESDTDSEGDSDEEEYDFFSDGEGQSG